MSGFFYSPTFNPPQPPVPIGSSGQVLTVQAGGGLAFNAAGGGAAGTNRAALNLAGGANNNLNPHPTAPTWPNGYGRVILTTTSGVANVTGMVAGTDGQYVFIFNNDAANNITLNFQNAGSLAANRFAFTADLVLVPSDGVLVVYDSTIARWLIS